MSLEMDNEFTAKPRVVQNKQKYRSAKEREGAPQRNLYSNMMFEKRIIRGNTYARVLNKENEEASNEFMNSQSQEAQKIMNQQILDYQKPHELGRTERNGYHFDEEGCVILKDREHVQIETDPNVESITNKAPNYEKDTQTEFKIEKKVVRHYMAQKTGLDRGTQIKDGELFDFDYEVEPLLQALCGKSLEISKMEVIQEEELRAMKQEQARLKAIEEKENAQTARLEQEEAARYEAMQKVKAEMGRRRDTLVTTHQQIVGRQLSKTLLGNLKQNALNRREKENGFMDSFTYQLNGLFLDWSTSSVGAKLDHRQAVQELINSTAQKQMQHVLRQHSDNIDSMNTWRQRMTQESLEKTAREEAEQKRLQEERDARREQRRQNRLREEMKNRLLAKGELKEKLLGHLISDLDNNEQNSAFVGVPGGVMGLVLRVYQQYLEEQVEEAEREELVSFCLLNVLEGILEEGGQMGVPVMDSIQEELAALELTLEGLSSIEDQAIKTKVADLLKAHINSKTLNRMANLSPSSAQCVGWMKEAVVGQFFQEEGSKGILFQMVSAQNVIEKFQHPGYMVLKPVFPQEEEQEEKKDTDEEEEEQQETASQKETRLQEEFYDQDLENKVTTLPNKDEDLEALVLHWAPTVTLLKDLLAKAAVKNEALANNNDPENLKKILLDYESYSNSQFKEICLDNAVRCEVASY